MAETIRLEDATIRLLDTFVASGRFASREEGVREAIRLLEEDSGDAAVDWDALDPATLGALEEGLADADAGRTEDAEIVFARLRARYANWSHAVE